MKQFFLPVLFFILPIFSVAYGKILDSLEIEGLVVNQSSVVRNSTGLKNGSDFTGSDIQEAIKNLYHLGLFKKVNFYTVVESDSSATLLIRLEEFPVCESIEYSGNKKLKNKDLEEAVTLKPGQVAGDELVFNNVKALKDLYVKKGYLLAEVSSQLVPTKIPGNSIVKFVVKEGEKVRIKKISFTGNTAFKEGKLKWNFKTKEDRWWRSGEYDEKEYRKNIDSLVMWYNDQGFLDMEVVKDSVWFADNKKDIYVTLQVNEGKKFYVGDFFIVGNSVLATDSLREKITMRKGKIFQKSKYDMTKYLIEDAYREEGFLWVRVLDGKSYRGDTVDVTFTITEGRAAVVRRINIAGNNKTMDKVVRREVRLLPAQKYKQSAMARSARDLMQLNYFNNVKPDLKPNDDGTIDLVIDVEEKDNIGQLSVGAAYGATDGFVGTFTTSIPNFRGAGEELNLNIKYGLTSQDYSIGFIEPWAFDRHISLSGSIFYQRYIYSGTIDTTTSYGFTAGIGTKLKWPDDYFGVSGTYRLSQEDEYVTDATYPEAALVLPHRGILSRLSLRLYRNDTEIDPDFPDKGSIFSILPEFAGLGGDYSYFKTTVSYDWYFPLLWKLVLGTKSKFGILEPLPGTDNITISHWDLFSAGGVYSAGMLRGYDEYQFGGRSSNPQTGLTMLALTAMLQFPVLEHQIYLSVFGDMGNTWENLRDIDPADMYKGIGAGMRIKIPMLGLMGFDFAWKLDNPNKTTFANDPANDRFRLHFLMNQGF